MRSRTIQKLRETQSPNPYPHKGDVSASITSYIEKYGVEGKIQSGKRLEGVTESLAGRIHNIRMSSQKLRFYDLHGEGKKVQIMANLRWVTTSPPPNTQVFSGKMFITDDIEIGMLRMKTPSSPLTISSAVGTSLG